MLRGVTKKRLDSLSFRRVCVSATAVWVLPPTAWADDGLLVAFGGSNRTLIVSTLVVLFTVSVVAYWLRRIMYIRRYQDEGQREWLAPPPVANPSGNLDGESQGFSTLEPVRMLDELGIEDEPTLYEELSDASSVHTEDYRPVRSWDRNPASDGLDILDMNISSYVTGFRDEYFLVEAKDMWMKRFYRRGLDLDPDRFAGDLPGVPSSWGDKVLTLESSLVESVVGHDNCLLVVRYHIVLLATASGEKQKRSETWTYSSHPQVDSVFRVITIEA